MSIRVTRSSAASQAAVLAVSKTENLPLQSSPLATKSTVAKKKRAPARKKDSRTQAKTTRQSLSPNTGTKRKRDVSPKVEDNTIELPHNLGRVLVVSEVVVSKTEDAKISEPLDKKQKVVENDPQNDHIKTEETAEETTIASEKQTRTRKSKKPKAHPYGLTPGISPFPDWPHPTPEECQIVNNILTKAHGEYTPPATIPKPSLTVSGCGEVPSILDAMIRTRLSAATTAKNSGMAFAGLVDRFGISKEGIGKNSVNWDAVRRADIKDVMDAIKCGGLGKEKSKDIKGILDMVYEENQARAKALLEAETDPAAAPKGAENESAQAKQAEVVRAEKHVLSLDHLHALEDNDAMLALVRYPGIGVKTASCVMLFCMRRPSLAVDTHVFRLLKWLNWVPPDVKSENTAFRHVEVRVPNEFKYSLHQLFIQHGKNCGRCRAATGETSVDWDKGCPIDHLVARTGKRKGKKVMAPKVDKKDFFVKRLERKVVEEKVALEDVEIDAVKTEDNEKNDNDPSDGSELSELSDLSDN